jgi:hypothetical protein
MYFYKYSERLLPLNQYYTDWLLVNYRKNSKKISLEPTLLLLICLVKLP